jgi:hypothetical protein
MSPTPTLNIYLFEGPLVVGKDPGELLNTLKKKIALPEEDIKTLILFNSCQPTYSQ